MVTIGAGCVSGRWRMWHRAMLLSVALLCVAAGGWFYGHFVERPKSAERAPTGGGARSYAVALQRAEATLAGARFLARDRGGEWLFQERLAYAFMARGRLTGSLEDYAAAQAALDRAFATAEKGAGPHQAQLTLAMAMHRLAKAGQMADAIGGYAVRPEVEERSELVLVRGDIAFYRGDSHGALRLYESSGADPGDARVVLRLAELAARTGDPDRALALIDQAERTARLPNAQFLAELALRRGVIALRRGDRVRATSRFSRANRLFPGWWLAQAHLAQIDALEGRGAAATRAFEHIAAMAHSPEAMDALASLYRAAGDARRSKLWADRAGAIWARRFQLFPEAAAGHAAEHELAFGDPAKALAYARADAAARPYGLPQTTLAWALLANGDAAAALAALRPAFDAGWTSAESRLAASRALLLLGREDEGEEQREAALKIDPHAADATATLLWFGH